MLSRRKTHIFSLVVLTALLNTGGAFAQEAKIAPINVENLPINASANNDKARDVSNPNKSLVSPSKPQASSTQNTEEVGKKDADKDVSVAKGEFDFDLKMKKITPPKVAPQIAPEVKNDTPAKKVEEELADLPKDIQYKSSPLDSLGNNILSQMDDDLFKQMSDIEKSTGNPQHSR